MQPYHEAFSFKRVIFRHSLWLSLLLHALLLTSFVSIIDLSAVEKEKPKPSVYIPSFATNPPMPTPVAKPLLSKPVHKHKHKRVADSKPQTDKSAIPAAKQAAVAQPTTVAAVPEPKPVYKPEQEPPVHVIGDKKSEDPLITLLGRAISARLVYPRAAADFRVKGTTYIGFTLHPNGEVTGTRVMQSSGTQVLDAAALRGIQAISPLGGANSYVPKPRFLVVGIIFK